MGTMDLHDHENAALESYNTDYRCSSIIYGFVGFCSKAKELVKPVAITDRGRIAGLKYVECSPKCLNFKLQQFVN
jgi:hypothetical protein